MYQLKFGKITKALSEDTMVDGTLVFEKWHSVPIQFMVEQDDTAPKEEAAPVQRLHAWRSCEVTQVI